MGQQLLFVARTYTWSIFLERLRQGEPDAYFIAIVTVLGIAVTLRAGFNTLKKDTRR